MKSIIISSAIIGMVFSSPMVLDETRRDLTNDYGRWMKKQGSFIKGYASGFMKSLPKIDGKGNLMQRVKEAHSDAVNIGKAKSMRSTEKFDSKGLTQDERNAAFNARSLAILKKTLLKAKAARVGLSDPSRAAEIRSEAEKIDPDHEATIAIRNKDIYYHSIHDPVRNDADRKQRIDLFRSRIQILEEMRRPYADYLSGREYTRQPGDPDLGSDPEGNANYHMSLYNSEIDQLRGYINKLQQFRQ